MKFVLNGKRYNLWNSLRKEFWFEMKIACWEECYRDNFPIKIVLDEDGIEREQKQYPIVLLEKYGVVIFQKWIEKNFTLDDKETDSVRSLY